MADRVALIGSETLMGRELRDLLAGNSLGADLRLISSADDSGAVLSESAGEAVLIGNLDGSALSDADAILLAGTPESARKALELAPGKPVIDVTHALEADPRSRLRAPAVEPHDFAVPPDAIHSIAHPAAVALALLLQRIDARYALKSWVVHIFEPASERGSSGIDELQQQTVSLLSFKPMTKKVFDAQLSFNMLAQLGEEAPVPLEQVEHRIERHLVTLLERAHLGPIPSIRVLQAPVFHGYSFSVWAEFEGRAPEAAELEAALSNETVDVRGSRLEPPNNVSIAGQDGISAGAITRDANRPQAAWIWLVADNLRLAAATAVSVLGEVI